MRSRRSDGLGRRTWLAGAAAMMARRAAHAQDGHAKDGHAPADGSAHKLRGQTVAFGVLGVAEWHPSTLIAAMAPDFVAFAKEHYGYDVDFRYRAEPFEALYQHASAALSGKAADIHLVAVDSQWLGAFAAPKWVLPLNPLIEANPELDIEWYAPQVRDAYQLYPDGSNNRWGLPQSGDTLALFVRRDRLEALEEQTAFRAKYGVDLPRVWEDFERLTWDDYKNLLAFFTRPDQNLFGLASYYSGTYDFVSCPAVSFMLGQGGQVWVAKTGQVEGVLNTESNARALQDYMSLLDYQPPGAPHFGIAEVAAAFSNGTVFSALQWAAAGLSMIPPELQDKVIVVPPPGFASANGDVRRDYVIGGQSWVVNAANDDARMLVAVDFLKWWYRPETALAFAKRGGMPCDKITLSEPAFDAIAPWLRTYKYMLPRSSDLWRDPKFVELLAVQQEAFGTRPGAQAKHVLDVVACRQQAILFEGGSAERRPSDECLDLKL